MTGALQFQNTVRVFIFKGVNFRGFNIFRFAVVDATKCPDTLTVHGNSCIILPVHNPIRA